jgi:hypothetical protein
MARDLSIDAEGGEYVTLAQGRFTATGPPAAASLARCIVSGSSVRGFL